ncbi:MAG: hypothetical protein KDA42_05795 [Planctomycetales bacterium]|nr:hypothetical protein [Planctomycetales bacterium]
MMVPRYVLFVTFGKLHIFVHFCQPSDASSGYHAAGMEWESSGDRRKQDCVLDLWLSVRKLKSYFMLACQRQICKIVVVAIGITVTFLGVIVMKYQVLVLMCLTTCFLGKQATADEAAALDTILSALQKVHPKTENIGEWAAIESVSRTAQDYLRENRNSNFFKARNMILKQLSLTAPKKDNRTEWEIVRNSANAAISNSSGRESMIIILTTLGSVTPGRTNRTEWKFVNDEARKALKLLQ